MMPLSTSTAACMARAQLATRLFTQTPLLAKLTKCYQKEIEIHENIQIDTLSGLAVLTSTTLQTRFRSMVLVLLIHFHGVFGLFGILAEFVSLPVLIMLPVASSLVTALAASCPLRQ